MEKCVVWVAHGALHFVVDNALVLQTTFRVIRDFEFYAMTFLAEVKIVQVGEESAICVD